MSEEKKLGRGKQKSSRHFVDQYMLAVLSKRKKDYDSCIDIMTKALAVNESRALGYSGSYFLGGIYLLTDKPENALVEFKKCLQIKENDPSALCRQGMCYVAMNDIEAAKKSFDLSIEHNDTYNEYSRISRPYYELCIIYRKEGDLEKAREVIGKALDFDETNVFYQCEKLLLGAQIENSFDEALLQIDQIIEENLKKEDVFAYPYYIKGICLQVKEAFQEAFECISKAFEVRVDYRRVQEHELYVNRGYYAFQIGEFESCLEDFLKAKEMIETRKSGEFTCYEHNKMGSCYIELGDVEKAMECFQKAIGMKEIGEFYENMGNCHMILSQDNEDEFEKAAHLYYKAFSCEGGMETFQSYENLGAISEYFSDSMKGENILLHMCRAKNPPPSLDEVLFLSKEMDIDPHVKNEYDKNLLMYLLNNPNGIRMDIIEKLTEETEIDVHEVEQQDRWSLCHFAAGNRNVTVEILKTLFEKYGLEDYEFKELDSYEKTVLLIHCSNGNTNLDVLKHLLEEMNFAMEDVCLDGKNCLHYLCETGPENVECIVYLLKKGVSIDQEDQSGKKPLDYLSEEIREKVMKLKGEE